MKTICVQAGYSGREVLAIFEYATRHKVDSLISKEPIPYNKDFVNVGSVEFVQKCFKKPIIPNYYPQRYIEHLHRTIDLISNPPKDSNLEVFAKPADQYKRFDGGIYTLGELIGECYVSEILSSSYNEYRYYVLNGEILTSGWYKGPDEDVPVPELDIDFGKDTGAFDFAFSDDGIPILIEYQHPFACGWYGESIDNHKYIEWLIKGWETLDNGNEI